VNHTDCRTRPRRRRASPKHALYTCLAASTLAARRLPSTQPTRNGNSQMKDDVRSDVLLVFAVLLGKRRASHRGEDVLVQKVGNRLRQRGRP